jgi:hypothetical protein
VDGKTVGRKSGSTARGDFSRRLNLTSVGALPASFVAAKDPLKAILSRNYSDWVDCLGSERLKAGVAKFFQSVMDGLPDRIKCELNQAAVKAGHGEILVSLKLSRQEQELLSALGARQQKAVGFHLEKLGFLNV